MFADNIKIGDKHISENSPCFIIAEAGVNHNGNLSLAMKMIDVAAAAGADAIKFQSFQTEELILQNVPKAPYQKNTTQSNESQYQMLMRLEMSENQTKLLYRYCKKKRIMFISTPFDLKSARFLHHLGVDCFKIASTDATNLIMLQEIAGYGKPIILSTGMCSYDEVVKVVKVIKKLNNRLVLLQCTANYPILDKEANLLVMERYKEEFNCLVGYSDHTLGVGAAPYAVALGAKIIEKHFTLDRKLPGPDHRASVEPAELEELIKQIRKVEEYLGNNKKKITSSENATRKALQKSLVASRSIMPGEKLSLANITAKRTCGKGISAICLEQVLRCRSVKKILKDEIITYGKIDN